ncbi:MAG TPA: hypothetical protein VGK73_38420 [Polyangiaceae bacterium]
MQRWARPGALLIWLAVAWLASCGGKQEPAGEGEDCYRDSDCKPGLVCVPSGEARKCSADTTGLVSTVDAPPMQMPPGAGGTMDGAGGVTAGTGAEPATGGSGAEPATGGSGAEPATGGTGATGAGGALGGAGSAPM